VEKTNSKKNRNIDEPHLFSWENNGILLVVVVIDGHARSERNFALHVGSVRGRLTCFSELDGWYLSIQSKPDNR
jgi:hypothetical protein